MHIFTLLVPIVLLILIYFVSKSNHNLIASILANFPILSLSTFLMSDNPKHTALYLAIFSMVVAVSFFIAYLVNFNSRFFSVLLICGVWTFLTCTVVFLIRR